MGEPRSNNMGARDAAHAVGQGCNSDPKEGSRSCRKDVILLFDTFSFLKDILSALPFSCFVFLLMLAAVGEHEAAWKWSCFNMESRNFSLSSIYRLCFLWSMIPNYPNMFVSFKCPEKTDGEMVNGLNFTQTNQNTLH